MSLDATLLTRTGVSKASKKDPNAPKKGRSAYILFSMDTRAQVKADFPDLKNTEILAKLGELWKALRADDKAVRVLGCAGHDEGDAHCHVQVYEERAAAEKAAADARMAEYKRTATGKRERSGEEQERPASPSPEKKSKTKAAPVHEDAMVIDDDDDDVFDAESDHVCHKKD